MPEEYADYSLESSDLFDRDTIWDERELGELLAQSQASTRERLEHELERIDDQLDQRDTVHVKIIDELEDML